MDPRALALAGLSGLLLAASFPPVDLNILAWISLVPLLLAIRNRTPREAFWLGGAFGLVQSACTIYWIAGAIHDFGGVPLVLAAGLTLLISAYCALYPAVFASAAVHLEKNRPLLFLAAAPALWTALELARTYVISGTPWLLLGYAPYRSLPLIQVADITGVYGISFLIVLVNAALARFIGDRRSWRPLVAVGVVLLAVYIYGSFRLTHTRTAGDITISVVQGNIDQDKKWKPAYQAAVTAIYRRLTLKALEAKPDLVLWPETSTPFYFGGRGDNAVRTDDLLRFVRSTGTPLLVGSATQGAQPGPVPTLWNSAFFLDRDGAVDGIYSKRHLVPFGEYVPLRNGPLFFIDKLVQNVGEFQPGTDYTVVGVRSASAGRNILLSTVICYEIIFPDLVRQFVDRGATVMTTLTNDAWFGRTGAPFQHFAMAVFRAVENHVPVARAANTGISGFIDANGRILETSGIFTETVLTRTLSAGATRTFYTRYGDVFSYLCVLASLVAVAVPSKSRNQ